MSKHQREFLRTSGYGDISDFSSRDSAGALRVGSSAESVGKKSESTFSEALQGKKNILFRQSAHLS